MAHMDGKVADDGGGGSQKLLEEVRTLVETLNKRPPAGISSGKDTLFVTSGAPGLGSDPLMGSATGRLRGQCTDRPQPRSKKHIQLSRNGFPVRKSHLEFLHIKVVACYHQLSSCVGGSTDGAQLRHELRQTRERAQQLALDSRRLLTARLRDGSLAPPTRLEAELLWVSFSSSLELLHADMCKVFSVGQNFPLSSNPGVLVQTGMQGETAKVTARALSLTEPDLNEAPASVDRLEQDELEAEKAHVDQMIEDMEQRVNVLRWTVEAQGPQYAEPDGGGSSLALLSVLQAEPERHRCKPGQKFVAALVASLAAVALLLSVGVLYLG